MFGILDTTFYDQKKKELISVRKEIFQFYYLQNAYKVNNYRKLGISSDEAIRGVLEFARLLRNNH